MHTEPIKSFAALAAILAKQDQVKAANLRKAASLPRPAIGPRIAR